MMKSMTLLTVLCAFCANVVLSGQDIDLIVRKIRHIGERLHGEILTFGDLVESRTHTRIHHLRGELVEKFTETVNNVLEQDVGKNEISQVKTEFGKLVGDYRALAEVVGTCDGNYTDVVQNKNQSMCGHNEENRQDLIQAVDGCTNATKKLMRQQSGLKKMLSNTRALSAGSDGSGRPSPTCFTGYSLPTESYPRREEQFLTIMSYNTEYIHSKLIHMDLTCHDFQKLRKPTRSVRAAVYIAKEKKLMLAYSYWGIALMNLDGNGGETIRDRVRVYGMAYHEEEDSVYMSTNSKSGAIEKMTTDGKTYRTIASLEGYNHLEDVVIDKRKRKLYVLDWFYIISMTLDGKDITQIRRHNGITAIALDHFGDLLYVHKSQLMKLSFKKNISLPLCDIGFSVQSLVLHNNRLYVGERISPWRESSARVGIVELDYGFLTYTIRRLVMQPMFGLILLLT